LVIVTGNEGNGAVLTDQDDFTSPKRRHELVDELKKALSEGILNTGIEEEHLDAEGIEGKHNHRNARPK
jgi:hypothetical protein